MMSSGPETRRDAFEETVSWLLAPIGLEKFLGEYYQQRLCLVKRGESDYYSDLLTYQDLDEVLGTLHLRHPKISMARAAEPVLASEFTYDGRVVDPVRVARLFDEGATVIFPHLHDVMPELNTLCSRLAQFFSSRMQTNVYFTPPGSRGFPPHWDTHDVFILQVFGSKAWKIYDTKIELPLLGQKFKLDNEEHEPGEVSHEFILEAGDMLYIPRGLMHSADALDESTLHVTTGLMAFNWAGLFLEVVSRAALEHRELRENLPLGFARPDFPTAELESVLADKLRFLVSVVEPAQAFAPFLDELVADHRPRMGDLLRQIRDVGEVGADSWIEPRLDAAYRLERADGKVTIKAFGNDVSFPDFAHEAVVAALERARYQVSDLPDVMDEKGKVVLVKRLIREGLLVHN